MVLCLVFVGFNIVINEWNYFFVKTSKKTFPKTLISLQFLLFFAHFPSKLSTFPVFSFTLSVVSFFVLLFGSTTVQMLVQLYVAKWQVSVVEGCQLIVRCRCCGGCCWFLFVSVSIVECQLLIVGDGCHQRDVVYLADQQRPRI